MVGLTTAVGRGRKKDRGASEQSWFDAADKISSFVFTFETGGFCTKMDSTLRQPKKRFVGRRTADAQAQANPTNGDVESTAVQKGMVF